ncbi:hypothetical protein HY78_26250 [Rhizorhabdus wittichii DC-6]|nr:hypothetical protein HY78_26250 [Rhizorhabdus wittichii DC-6]
MREATNHAPILVTGATGAQGGAVARALLAQGVSVRALVRDPNADAARALAQQGATLAIGSFEDTSSLDAALAGCGAVFSVQLAPPPSDPDSERNQARVLIAAARRAGVRHLVHSSVSNTGDYETMPGWAEGRWTPNYWRSKGDVEAMVRDAGFAAATILRPAFMMENFAEPKARGMFPDLRRRRILTAVAPDSRIALIAAADIGAAVAAAIADPGRFGDTPLEMAGDHLTLDEVAAIIGAAKGVAIHTETWDEAALVAHGQHDGWVRTQSWLNVVGYPARPAMMTAAGLRPTAFIEWVARHGDTIVIDQEA